MAKKRRTAPRDIAGRPGAAGAAGPTGARLAGAARKSRAAGHAGRQGARGAHGVTGMPGPAAAPDQALPSTHVQLLEVVETQIEDIYQVLDVQVRRFAQIQQQVDELRGKVHQLMEKARI
jgi:hypothetical protein